MYDLPHWFNVDQCSSNGVVRPTIRAKKGLRAEMSQHYKHLGVCTLPGGGLGSVQTGGGGPLPPPWILKSVPWPDCSFLFHGKVGHMPLNNTHGAPITAALQGLPPTPAPLLQAITAVLQQDFEDC